MEIALYTIGSIASVIWLWLNSLATFALRHDSTLERFQVISQTIIVWLVPYFGAALVLHLVWQQYPEAIPKSWVPWPFKKMIFGNAPAPNQNRDDDESQAINGALSDHVYDFHDFGGNGDGCD